MHKKNVRISKIRKFAHSKFVGNFVIAHAVTRKAGDVIKSIMNECLLITIDLTSETQNKRIMKRHGSDGKSVKFSDYLTKMYQFYEKAGENEEKLVLMLLKI